MLAERKKHVEVQDSEPKHNVVTIDAAVVEKTQETEQAEENPSLTPLRKAEVLDMVIERSGLKKKFVKPAFEATLEVLAELMSETNTLNMEPLGKVNVVRIKEVGSARITTCRVRHSLGKQLDASSEQDVET